MMNSIELTRSLLQFNTVNPPGQERECAHFLGGVLEAAGFETAYFEFDDQRTTLVAQLGKADRPAICFTGHIDTVPLGTKQWTVDPFAGETNGDLLFGRGSSDMKAGVAAFVCAAIELSRHIRKGPGVMLIITASEETGCQGASHLVATAPALRPAGAIVVGEPTSNYPLLGHKGALWLEVSTEGRTSHGSMPDQGVNAIYRAARAVTKLESYQLGGSETSGLGDPTLNIGTFVGGTSINIVPDFAKFSVDIRTLPGMDHCALRQRIADEVAPEHATVSTLMDLKAVWTNPEHAVIESIFDVVKQHTGEAFTPRGASYFTDACALHDAYPGTPIVILGPGDPGQAHKTDEHCQISRIEQAVEIYKELINTWAYTLSRGDRHSGNAGKESTFSTRRSHEIQNPS